MGIGEPTFAGATQLMGGSGTTATGPAPSTMNGDVLSPASDPATPVLGSAPSMINQPNAPQNIPRTPPSHGRPLKCPIIEPTTAPEPHHRTNQIMSSAFTSARPAVPLICPMQTRSNRVSTPRCGRHRAVVRETASVEPRRSFDSVAAVYERIRPGYPPALFDDLFALLRQDPQVLEVGPGPGKATRDLLAHGAQVHAVEIGPALAETLRATLPSHQLTVEVGDFENVPVVATAFDCVFAASAYHWITPRAQLDRPAALLKPDGALAVVDLIQVDSSNDRGFFAAAQPIYTRHGQGHSGPPAPPRDAVEPPISLALNDDDRFTATQVLRYDWDQTYTSAEYRLLMESYSVTQMMPPSERRALLDDIESFVRDQFDNEVVRSLVVTLTTARLVISS